MLEIRWHGRGGQGVVTAAKLLAEAAAGEGKFVQAMPEYGPERAGAPVRAFTRISDEQITLFSGIYTPDVVVVIDPLMAAAPFIIEGLKEGGTLIVNSPEDPAEIKKKLGNPNVKVCSVDATKIAIETIGRPIPNTPMIGAFAKATGKVSLDAVKEIFKKKFAEKLSPKALEGNLKAIGRAYEEVKCSG